MSSALTEIRDRAYIHHIVTSIIILSGGSGEKVLAPYPELHASASRPLIHRIVVWLDPEQNPRRSGDCAFLDSQENDLDHRR
ncbi:hypothetical protein [Opitutus terrae]|uniref:hypothetical protein n=1 Tax=Opitutus terrae TaxID=107709 RepID=UPI0011D14C4D|nr:hypothetical protein [Opitutus terrae]